MTHILRRVGVLLALPLLLFSACSDETEVALSGNTSAAGKSADADADAGTIRAGMSVDAVYAAIGQGQFTGTGPADTIRIMHGHRAQMFVTSSRLIRVLFARQAKGTLDGPIQRSNDTPIVIEGASVLGYGWADFDRLAKDIGLPPFPTVP
jgi:hypothetical protein